MLPTVADLWITVKQLSSTTASRKEGQRDLHTVHRVTIGNGFHGIARAPLLANIN